VLVAQGALPPLPASSMEAEPKPPYVTIRMLGDQQVKTDSITVIERIPVPAGTRVTGVHGGVLVGVAMRAAGATADTLSFFNWDGTPTSATPPVATACRALPDDLTGLPFLACDPARPLGPL
jgi:hypothetical protein